MEKLMRKRTSLGSRKTGALLVLSALLFFSGPLAEPVAAKAQVFNKPQELAAENLSQSIISPSLAGPIDSDNSMAHTGQLFSSSISQKFYEIAYELANSEDAEARQLKQAIVFLTAAMNLDNTFKEVHPLLIKLACRDSEQDHSQLVYDLLIDYVDESADVEIAKRAVEYLLSRLNAREQREKLLEQMLGALGGKNNVLASELATMLGLLKTQKEDLETAEFYFIQAYQSNRYNKLPFVKLAEIKPERIGPAIYLERLRLELRENPSNINAAFDFAQNAEQLQLYDTAAAAYEYCADLFSYLYPSEDFPPRIYLPWAISSYNSERNLSKCLQIAQRIQQEGRFDLRIEAIAGKAVTKMGKGQVATQIFQSAEKKAQQLLKQTSKENKNHSETLHISDSQQITNNQLAWFYCFALPLPDEALDWANKANITEPNSPDTIAILAYALTMNNQMEWAKPIINNHQRNQIADLAMARIQMAEGQNDSAIQTLNNAIAKDPGSLAAERAKDILAELGVNYIPPVDPDAVLNVLKNVFGPDPGGLIPVFTTPERVISAQLDIKGDEFAYGSEFKGSVELKNNSQEPLVISDDALFKGNIRIDAEISGDLNIKIAKLVSEKIRTTLLIDPGRSILIPVRLFTGELRETLIGYPQASLNIEFTLYLDPVVNKQGKVTNRLTYLKPAGARIKRPGIKLTGKYIRSRFNLISNGSIGQKIKTARLFTGLLNEQYAMLNRKPLYRFLYADWMEPLLRSALLHESGLLRNPNNGDWVVKVYTMAEMVSLPLDYELISAVAKNLDNTNWPVRMMAVYLLSKTTNNGFDKVLDWTMKNDSNKLVRDIALALGRPVSNRQW
jgi:hypothetical protein